MKNRQVLKVLFFCYLGTLVFSFGINAFLIPNNLGEGGVTGITFMLYYLYEIPTAYTNLLLNGILLFVGYKFLDRKTMIYTVITVLMLSLNLHLTEEIPQLTENLLVATIVGGILSGAGLGIIIKIGSTTAGTTIVAKLMEKYFKWKISYSLLLCDFVVVIFGLKIIGLENTIYTIVMLLIGTEVMEYMLKSKKTKEYA